jgi:hypothetical protein
MLLAQKFLVNLTYEFIATSVSGAGVISIKSKPLDLAALFRLIFFEIF